MPAPVLTPATGKTRQVTPSIRTVSVSWNDWIVAEYRDTRVYRDPFDAPVYAIMRPQRAGGLGSGKYTGAWWGTITIQALEKGEAAALAALLEQLDQLQLPYEREAARAALVALASATAATPWQYHPIGVLGRKPRPKRHRRWSPTEGKRIHIYADTLRRHRDPDCQCEHCVISNAVLKPTPPRRRKSPKK